MGEFACNFCTKSFRQKQSLIWHIRVHTGERPYACDQCPIKFSNSRVLKRHKLSHSGERPFICPVCLKTFKVKWELKCHTSIVHINTRAYKCTICFRKYKRLASLNLHVKLSHTETPAISCIFCGKRLSSKSALEKHLHQHTKERTVFCSVCEMEFIDGSQLNIHIRRKHGNREEWSISCVFCGKRTATHSELNLHLKSHTKERYYWCGQCSATFTSGYSLKIHEHIHTGKVIKPYSCQLCGMKFIRKSGHDRHMLSHTGEKAYQCACGKRYKVLKATRNCKRKHKILEREESLRKTGEGQLKCEFCPERFHHEDALPLHNKALHSKQETFDCEICGRKGIKQMGAFRTHLLTHKNRERFCCSFCPAKYSQKNSLTNHVRYVHDSQTNTKFECIFCKKKHPKKGKLEDHLRTHIRECPNFCGSCPAEFSCAGALRGHQARLHNSGEQKQHKCEICKKSFFAKCNLTTHFAIHTGEKCHKCGVCGEEFRLKVSMQRHIKSVHGI